MVAGIDCVAEFCGIDVGSAAIGIGTVFANGVFIKAGATAAVVIAAAAGINFFVEFIGMGDDSAATDIGTDAHNGVSVAAGGTAAVVFTAVVGASTAVAGITVDTKNAEDVGIFSNEGIADDTGMIAADVDAVFNTGSFIDVAAVSFIDICPIVDVASTSGGGVCNHGAVVNPLKLRSQRFRQF